MPEEAIAIVWRSYFGEGCSGARAWDNQQEILASHISRRRTAAEQGNPDGTCVVLVK